MPKKPRARTARREKERTLDKTVRALEKLTAAAEGGGPARAILVPGAAVVETRARAMPCALCGGALELREHRAEFHGGEQLRVAQMACVVCHAKREIWFRIGKPLPS